MYSGLCNFITRHNILLTVALTSRRIVIVLALTEAVDNVNNKLDLQETIIGTHLDLLKAFDTLVKMSNISKVLL